ncbi:hypothetical protein D3877_28020 [Azospirillum cavernae]|uniref:C1q domain-containing protein n=2 Tax=Azospirillum cavernae TaxID=2320860 RepID=A0A418VKR7_9PROT|nr:hypothetical protein D3877_28020 [Azospirillum cavernae]
MTIIVDAGHLLNGATLTEVNPQTVGPFTATPSQRVDRVVVDRTAGTASIVVGTDGSVTPPALPAGKLPVARVHLLNTLSFITNAVISDERALSDLTTSSLANEVFCRITLNGVDQTGVPNSTATRVNLTTADFNVGAAFDTTTCRFKPTVGGYFIIAAQVNIVNSSSGVNIGAAIYKNGAAQSWNFVAPARTGNYPAQLSDIVQMNGTTDYVELYCSQDNGAARSISGAKHDTWFSASRLR